MATTTQRPCAICGDDATPDTALCQSCIDECDAAERIETPEIKRKAKRQSERELIRASERVIGAAMAAIGHRNKQTVAVFKAALADWQTTKEAVERGIFDQ